MLIQVLITFRPLFTIYHCKSRNVIPCLQSKRIRGFIRLIRLLRLKARDHFVEWAELR
jgi:hypothetical protein